MENELKPCPFCGSKNISDGEIVGKKPDGGYFSQTACLNCNAAGPEVDIEGLKGHEIGRETATAWNTRKDGE